MDFFHCLLAEFVDLVVLGLDTEEPLAVDLDGIEHEAGDGLAVLLRIGFFCEPDAIADVVGTVVDEGEILPLVLQHGEDLELTAQLIGCGSRQTAHLLEAVVVLVEHGEGQVDVLILEKLHTVICQFEHAYGVLAGEILFELHLPVFFGLLLRGT